MTKGELIVEIRTAFKNVKLENAIGLWEGQGLDNYDNEEELLKLRQKDERKNKTRYHLRARYMEARTQNDIF